MAALRIASCPSAANAYRLNASGCRRTEAVADPWNGCYESPGSARCSDAKCSRSTSGKLHGGILRKTGTQRVHSRFFHLAFVCQSSPDARPNKTINCSGGSSSSSSSNVEKLLPRTLLMRASAPDHLLAAATLRAQLLYEYPSASGRCDSASHGANNENTESQYTGGGAFGPMGDAIIADMYGLRLKNEFDRDLSFRLVKAHVVTYLAVCPWDFVAHMVSSSNGSSAALLVPPRLDPTWTTLPDGAVAGDYAAVGTLDIDMAEKLSCMCSRPWGRAIHRAMGVDAEAPECANETEMQLPGVPATTSGGTAYVFNLCVSQVVRRQGIARNLLSFALDDLLKQGKSTSVHVHVEVCNSAAMSLYTSLGFSLVHEESLADEKHLQRPRRSLLTLYPFRT